MAAPKKRSNRRNRTRRPSHARLGQHFFKSEKLAHQIVSSVGLQKQQSVLELGAGEGFFTNLIAPDVRSVTAVEIDPRLTTYLNQRFSDSKNVTIVRKSITSSIDFGDYDNVFGNIPFNRTADILRKVLQPPVRFNSCHLIVQTEAAYRLLGSGRPSEMALLAYPFVDVELGVSIPRWAYRPQPSVDTAPLHINTRNKPLISKLEYPAFLAFVRLVVNSGSRNLMRVVRRGISYPNWRRICAQIGIERNDSHGSLSPAQSIALFHAIRKH